MKNNSFKILCPPRKVGTKLPSDSFNVTLHPFTARILKHFRSVPWILSTANTLKYM